MIEIAQKHQIQLKPTSSAIDQLYQLITNLSKQAPVVLLIDEYDQPIIAHLQEPQIAAANRDYLKNFLGIIKSISQIIYLKMVKSPGMILKNGTMDIAFPLILMKKFTILILLRFVSANKKLRIIGLIQEHLAI